MSWGNLGLGTNATRTRTEAIPTRHHQSVVPPVARCRRRRSGPHTCARCLGLASMESGQAPNRWDNQYLAFVDTGYISPSCAPPPASLPSTSAVPMPTTTTGVDAYRYAVPGCFFKEDRLTERPTSFTFETCADGSLRLESMSWSSWGSSGAQGSGIFSYKVCEPNCAEGHRVQYAANVSAFNPRLASYNSGCPTDVMFYSEMIVSFPASSPNTSEISTDTTYLGRPAIRFTTSSEGTGQGVLGNLACY